MQFSVTFRHVEATDALKEYARERMEKIRKYFPDPIAVHVVMSTERGYNHRVDVTMQLHNGLTVAGRESSESMYSSLDLVTAKIERQVRRYKDKLRSHKVKNHLPSVPWSHTVLAEGEASRNGQSEAHAAADDAIDPAVDGAMTDEAVSSTADGAESPGPGLAAGSIDEPIPVALAEPKVVKTEQFHADPMSVSEAIMQLNLLHKEFLVFRHDESGLVNVVYRRGDDSYGLIEATAPTS